MLYNALSKNSPTKLLAWIFSGQSTIPPLCSSLLFSIFYQYDNSYNRCKIGTEIRPSDNLQFCMDTIYVDNLFQYKKHS